MLLMNKNITATPLIDATDKWLETTLVEIDTPEIKENNNAEEYSNKEERSTDSENEFKEKGDVQNKNELAKGVHFSDVSDELEFNTNLAKFYKDPRDFVPDTVQKLNASLLGDTINPIDGRLSFQQTDISLPGNSHLPVEFTRKFSGFFKTGAYEFGEWRLNIPSLETMVMNPDYTLPADHRLTSHPSMKLGWHNDRCDTLMPPNFHYMYQNSADPDGAPNHQTKYKYSNLYFAGITLNAPNSWGEQLLSVDKSDLSTSEKHAVFGNDTPKYITKSNWRFECLTSIKNGAGQGFKATSPNGDVYFFDWLVYKKSGYSNDTNTRHELSPIYRAMLMATKVEDVYGNWVKYEYDVDTGYIKRIHANDLREINVDIVARKVSNRFGNRSDVVESAVVIANNKRWTYKFDQRSLEVILPSDGSKIKKWKYSFPSSFGVDSHIYDDAPPYVYDSETGELDPIHTESKLCDEYHWRAWHLRHESGFIKVTHPSGVIGEFNLRKKTTDDILARPQGDSFYPVLKVTKAGLRHFAVRDYFPCPGVSMSYQPDANVVNNTPTTTADYTLPISEKKLYGPGIDTLIWKYGYQQGEELFSGLAFNERSSLPTTTMRSILSPDGILTVHHINRVNNERYGKIERTDTYSAPNLRGSQFFEGVNGLGVFSEYLLQKSIEVEEWLDTTPLATPWQIWLPKESIGILKQLPNSALNTATLYKRTLPKRQKTIVYNQGGNDTYITEYSYNDNPASAGYSFHKPIKIEKYSSTSTASEYSNRRIKTYGYTHLKNQWVLGLVNSITVGNPSKQEVISQNQYAPNLPLIEKSYRFGKQIESNTYYANGLLKRKVMNVSPSRWVEYSSYHRGVPRVLMLSSGATSAKEVDDFGQVTKVTDFEGACTDYAYDDEFRLRLIDPCLIKGQGNSISQHSEWASTQLTYDYTTTSLFGGKVEN